MADEEKKKQELSKVEEQPKSQGLTLSEVMAHPVVQEMNKKLESMSQLLQQLPEAIGRAVAEAQRANSNRVPLVSGPPVSLRTPIEGRQVEFHRRGKIVEDGQEIAPEGPTQGDFNKDIEDIQRRAPPRKSKK